MLERTAERLKCSPFRTELMRRIEEMSSPLPSSMEGDIEAAKQRLNTMTPPELIDLFQRLFSPTLLERSAWALPSVPFVRGHGSTIPPEVTEYATGLLRELLDRGSLPQRHSHRSINAIAQTLPRYKIADVRNAASLGLVAMTSTLCLPSPLPLFLPALVAIPTVLYIRHLARKPDVHGGFAIGCLIEALDANEILNNGEKPPTLASTFHSYFSNPRIPASYHNPIHSEGFMAARTLRMFGYSGIEILSIFAARNAIGENGSIIRTLLAGILKEQDIELTHPLTTVFRRPSKETPPTIISLLEDVHAAHFAWAFRDKDLLRHQAAQRILESPSE